MMCLLPDLVFVNLSCFRWRIFPPWGLHERACPFLPKENEGLCVITTSQWLRLQWGRGELRSPRVGSPLYSKRYKEEFSGRMQAKTVTINTQHKEMQDILISQEEENQYLIGKIKNRRHPIEITQGVSMRLPTGTEFNPFGEAAPQEAMGNENLAKSSGRVR